VISLSYNKITPMGSCLHKFQGQPYLEPLAKMT